MRAPLDDPLTDASGLEDYLAGATGAAGDTRLDRIVAAYAALRRLAPARGWHRIPGLRDFSRTYVEENPYIPPAVRAAWARDREVVNDGAVFLHDWRAAGLPCERLDVDPDALLATVAACPELSASFAARNLHSPAYFYTKFTEWHLTLEHVRATGAERVVDLGAASAEFATVATTLFPALEVDVVDLGFAPGRRAVGDRITEVGADAGDLYAYPDGSVPLVCAHNAFEHFAGGADTRCVAEIARILAPGGLAVITPFFGAARHSVTVSPFSCYVAAGDPWLRDVVDAEVEDGAYVRLNPDIVSPYAHAYSLQTAQERVMAAAPGLEFTLREVDFDAPPAGAGFAGVPLEPDIYRRPVFLSLEMRKPGPAAPPPAS